jgi:O-antigen ligase
MTFARNLGTWDRAARFILGTLLIVLAITGTIGLWGYLGVIFVGTAFLNFCPIYRIVGIKTCTDC